MLLFLLSYIRFFFRVCCAGCVFWMLFIHSFVLAQDVHWSQFNANPVFQNPGNAGNFMGDLRFVGNFRDQWRAVSVPYQTISLSADSKLPKHQNVGLGGLFFHDATGDGRLRTVEIQANVSFHLPLSTDQKHAIRPGVNIGLNHRQVNWEAFHFGNQYNGFYYDASLPTNENYVNDKKSNLSVGIGGVYSYQISNKKQLDVGASLFNINQPNQGFFTQNIPRPRRSVFFVQAQHPLDFDLTILPSIQISLQGPYREFILGTSFKYTLVDRLATYRAVYAGLWHRIKDAVYISLGMDYQQWFFGLSYDINVSSLTPASHVRGGFEIAVRYILFRFIPQKNLHRICPDYI